MGCFGRTHPDQTTPPRVCMPVRLLQWAAKRGYRPLVGLSLRCGAQANSKALDGTRPLMMACKKGQAGVVQNLLLHMCGQGLEEPDTDGFFALHYAAGGGYEEVVVMLLGNGAEANSKGHKGLTPLMIACVMGHVGVVRTLLQHVGVQGLEERCEAGCTALHFAAGSGFEEVVVMLLKNGAEANSRTQDGRTPLMMGCKEGHVGVVQIVLLHVGGQGLEDQSEQGGTALHYAASGGYQEVVAVLLNSGAQANSRTPDGTTPLMMGCKEGHVGVVQVLLLHMKGQGLEERCESGCTALHDAALGGCEQVVLMLLNAGAEANSHGFKGMTPLMLACVEGHMGMVQILLLHVGAQGLEERCERGYTALWYAACGGHQEVVAVLLNSGAHAKSQTPNGTIPLMMMMACIKGHVGVARMLLHHMGGRGLEETHQSGLTALHFAAHAGHEEVVAFLLGCGARADVQAADGSTPLMCAFRGGHMGVMKVLLGHNGPIGLQVTITGRTVLHEACWKGCGEELVRAFLLAGGDTTIRDNDGATPRALAEAQGHTQLVAVFNWWEMEMERPYLLHRAKCLHERSVKHPAAVASTAPAFLQTRVAAGLALPRVEVVASPQEQQGSAGDTEATPAADASDAGEGEEERRAVLAYVLEELNEQLFIELREGFHA